MTGVCCHHKSQPSELERMILMVSGLLTLEEFAESSMTLGS